MARRRRAQESAIDASPAVPVGAGPHYHLKQQ